MHTYFSVLSRFSMLKGLVISTKKLRCWLQRQLLFCAYAEKAGCHLWVTNGKEKEEVIISHSSVLSTKRLVKSNEALTDRDSKSKSRRTRTLRQHLSVICHQLRMFSTPLREPRRKKLRRDQRDVVLEQSFPTNESFVGQLIDQGVLIEDHIQIDKLSKIGYFGEIVRKSEVDVKHDFVTLMDLEPVTESLEGKNSEFGSDEDTFGEDSDVSDEQDNLAKNDDKSDVLVLNGYEALFLCSHLGILKVLGPPALAEQSKISLTWKCKLF